jgi:hypothetical protein
MLAVKRENSRFTAEPGVDCANSDAENEGAGEGTRTRNLLFTKQLLCQLSYAGEQQP